MDTYLVYIEGGPGGVGTLFRHSMADVRQNTAHHMVKDQCSLEWLARHAVLIDDVQKRDWLKNQASQSSLPADNRFRAHFLLWVARVELQVFPLCWSRHRSKNRMRSVNGW